MYCERCHTIITEQTFRIYQGRCVPCHRLRFSQRLSRALQDVWSNVIFFVTLPFQLIQLICFLFNPFRIRRFLVRAWYLWSLRSPKHRQLSFYKTLWCLSSDIYTGPVGPGAFMYPEARAWDRVVADPLITDADLVGGLSHANGIFATYCFKALLHRKVVTRAQVPASLYDRDDPVCIRQGCFRSDVRLGDYVRTSIEFLDPP